MAVETTASRDVHITEMVVVTGGYVDHKGGHDSKRPLLVVLQAGEVAASAGQLERPIICKDDALMGMVGVGVSD